ncbi:hypothetical protein BBP40_009842 [Aspergillus hancockii]|nr:hypothetical protein BBP40_009842 [Aspergillus hancockii]
MSSAKMTKVQKIIASWINGNPDVKIVVFTQFINCVRLLSAMCYNQKWGSTCLTGKTSLIARNQSMEKFRDDKDVYILIASLKAGGIGLDMSMATKCILVDLWIGQTQNVEVVKMVIEESIDEYLLRMQTRKTVEITSTMGDEILKKRDSIVKVLQMFGGTVNEDAMGVLSVQRNRTTQV